MRIALASCFNAGLRKYAAQPVWRNIAAHRPEVLVLLGDSIYLDVPWVSVDRDLVHPRDADARDFLRHGWQLYRKQLEVASFAALVRTPGLNTYALWDDHDFLWDGAAGGSVPDVLYRDHVRASRALFRAWREALTRRDPSAFAPSPDDPALNTPYESSIGASTHRLAEDLHLHLTDGRSYRNARDLLGSAQRSQLTEAIRAAPQAVHLIASGTVYAASRGESWRGYPEDDAWLRQMARSARILVLSGDIHRNAIPEPVAVAGGRSIFEIVSSGASVGTLVALGEPLHNFGMLEIAGGKIAMSTYVDRAGTPQYRRTIDIARWELDPAPGAGRRRAVP